MTSRGPVAPIAPSAPPAFGGRPLPHPDEPVFDQGLIFDVGTLLTRRDVIRAMGYGAIAVSAAACLPGATPGASAGGTATAGPTIAADACEVIPEETAGPYPGTVDLAVPVQAT
jgi:hypothetical protein